MSGFSTRFKNIVRDYLLFKTPAEESHQEFPLLGIIHRLGQILIIISFVIYFIAEGNCYDVSTHITSDVETLAYGFMDTRYLSSLELNISNPELYKRFWDSTDFADQSAGSKDGEIFFRTNVIITPNQTRGDCPEDSNLFGAKCDKNSDCPIGKSLEEGHGKFTGKCNMTFRSCEVHSWCPLPSNKLPFNSSLPLFKDIQNATFIVKNQVYFFEFNSSILNNEKDVGANYSNCLFHSVKFPTCNRFRLGDIVKLAGYTDFNKLAIYGGVLVLRVRWDCTLAWWTGIVTSFTLKYSVANLNSALLPLVTPGDGDNGQYQFSKAFYYGDNMRTHVRNRGIKIIVQVEGKARQFSWTKLLFGIGGSFGLVKLVDLSCKYLLTLGVAKKCKALCTLSICGISNFFEGGEKTYFPTEDNDTEEIKSLKAMIQDV